MITWTIGNSAKVALSTLAWDSKQIGISAARIDHLIAKGKYIKQLNLKKRLLEKVLQYSAVNGIQHISIRLDATDLSGIHALEQSGYILVDCLLIFSLDLNKYIFVEPTITTRLATPTDEEVIARLAGRVYIYDRFHSDPSISTERANKLHETWARNSCSGKVADVVILAEDGEGLLGFVTCKLQDEIGIIELVATAEHACRKGVATATTQAALNWFCEQGAKTVTVGTQLSNVPASRLYINCGFTLINSGVSLRREV